MILGVIGCCLGILGIFTLGLVFVPLAVLFSLIGLMVGLGSRSTSGIIAGIGGLTLSAIGFFSSPSLMLVASGLLVASQTGTGSSDSAQKRATSQPVNPSRIPEQEQRFCDITANASAKYFSLAADMKKARDEKNGILEKRIEEAMAATKRDRDAAILKLARDRNFKIDDWSVRMLKVGTPSSKRVTFSVRPLCSNIVTIHLTASPNGDILEVLAAKRAGDVFLVSGAFAGSRTDTDDPFVAPEAGRLEQSITERGAMEEPEYWALLKYQREAG
ncbi:hypothetical protein JQ629_09090 [Bradyrhizobium sp. AUGA SZCCT0222]|uniref:hypothetical protein n=1 Tax=Bradyrhizobium sp. AUGA SZCCT0222 TaxID=2807668 RepID=UPI001BA9D3C5|nr:hypothetical protein [Bradyrhizobium sp. AUGA SZCCT0222]MBR1267661.1 hypothetical protein [Bradyrhizobium sp. AUGA SZCCT0222]